MTAKLRKGVLIVAAGSVAACMLFALPSPRSAGFFDNFLSGGGPGNRATGFIPPIPFFGELRTRPRAQARPAAPRIVSIIRYVKLSDLIALLVFKESLHG
jgi:hypothetical protein